MFYRRMELALTVGTWLREWALSECRDQTLHDAIRIHEAPTRVARDPIHLAWMVKQIDGCQRLLQY